MKVGINPKQLRSYVIEPTLDMLKAWKPELKSEAAIRLLLGTAAHESRMGYYLHQVNGPAVGIYQMERNTHDDLFFHFSSQPTLNNILRGMRGFLDVDASRMAGNLYYATAMARLYYWRVSEPLPHEDDVEGLAAYAKKHWNTYMGRATIADYADAIREWEIA